MLDEIVADDGQRRVAEGREQPRFALERAIGVVAAGRHLLHRDGVVESQVDRFVDGAHAAAANRAQDAVAVVEKRRGL